MVGAVHICRFDSADHIVGKARTYEAVKQAVLAAGRFSVFEASSTQKNAKLFTRLCADPDVETFDLGYPWTGVRERALDDPKRMHGPVKAPKFRVGQSVIKLRSHGKEPLEFKIMEVSEDRGEFFYRIAGGHFVAESMLLTGASWMIEKEHDGS